MTNHNSSTPVGNRQSSQNDDIDLLAVFFSLWESKFTILACTFAFATAGIAYTILATPIYQANAIVQVEKKQGGIPGLSEVSPMFGVESASTTEIELLKSRRVISAAVKNLKLDIEATPKYLPGIGQTMARRFANDGGELASPFMGLRSYAWGGEKLIVDQFEIPDSQLGKEHTLISEGGDAYSLYSANDKKILQGVVGKTASATGYSIYISELNARPTTEFFVRKRRMLSTTIAYQGMLSATETSKDSGIIELSIQDPEPTHAENILNVIAEAYVRQNVERQSAEAAKSLEFLRDQLPDIKKDLESAEKRFNDYQVKVGSVNISAEASALLDQVVEIESAIAELQLQQAELNRKYTTDHPAFQAWREQMAEQRGRKADLSERIKGLPETQQELLGLKRDLEVGTEIYTQMLNNIQELDIVRAGTVGNVRIVDDAAVNVLSPVKPRKAIIVAIGTLLGGFLGVALVLVRKALNRGIENPDEIEALGLPVYASIPLSDEQRKLDYVDQRGKSSRKAVRAHSAALLAQRNPTDLAIESLRSLRTSLHFAMLESPNNIIMISGPSPNVGKSFVSGNLAAVVAQSGQRVLLIDMDLRKGYMHKMFEMTPDNGVSDILSQRIKLEDAIKPTKVAELSILPRGTIPPNPSELLMSKGLTELLEAVQAQFDLIIVDTPPVMAVTDAAIVGRHCGVTMLVSRFALNPAKELELTKQRFEQNGITVKGVVFNAVERRASSYGYGYGYYHYEYKSDN